MDNLHSSDGQNVSNSLPEDNAGTLQVYQSNSGSTQNANNLSHSQESSSTYSRHTPLSFTEMNIKEEHDIDDNTTKLSHPAINFSSGSVPVIASTSHMKVSNQVLSHEVPVVSQNMQLASGGSVIINSTEGCQKVLANHQSVIPLGQGVNFNSSLNLSSAVNQGTSVLSTSQASDVSQPVQMFHSSFDTCDGVLNQQPHSGQTFLLTSPGAVLSSNQMVSQGQVFLQGDELVGVTLATTSATNSGYTVSNSDSQYVSTLPMVLSGNQQIGNSIPRLIIQSNQAAGASPTLNNQIFSSNDGHYLIQVGHTVPSTTQQNNFSFNNKGHIVIKAGSSKVKESQESVSSPTKDGVFRVVIPEGTTKVPRISQPLQVLANADDSIRRHVQINLSNRANLPSPTKVPHYDTAVQTVKETKPPEKIVAPPRKLYECSNCNSKFMRPLYLRMHIRSCKKPEVKIEKTPLFMCSFCKATFKTKALITYHFTKCSHIPCKSKESVGKRKLEDEHTSSSHKKAKVAQVETSLELAVQYKCQDCDRTFSKERQYTSHVKRCTKVSVHDLTGARLEATEASVPEEDHDTSEDPFADPPLPPPPAPPKRGRSGGGRRGRPPGRVAAAAQKASQKNNVLFEGEKVEASESGLLVADNDNVVRSTTGLSHTLHIAVEKACSENRTLPMALLSDSKGVSIREKPPHAWSLVCSLCQKMFLTKPALAHHMMENHGSDLWATRNTLVGQNVEEKLFQCPLCYLHYQTTNTFLEHLVVQHTSKLQEQYKNLQAQTATFVCSLCSLVLLSKNMLMEHLSLEHLEQLEKTYLASRTVKKRKNNQVHASPSTNGDLKGSGNSLETPIMKQEEEEIGDGDKGGSFVLEPKSEDDPSTIQCGLCGDEFISRELIAKHYTESHHIDVDSNGVISGDASVDVDIRVKNTLHLLQLADPKSGIAASLPRKTVLIRKKPRQSFQCQSCQEVFTKQSTWLRHIRETCTAPSQSVAAEKVPKSTQARESHFFCHEPECSHLAFYQVKSLFKHMEEAHRTVVEKERKTFHNLSAFSAWLTEEEDRRRVRFIRDCTRMEKNNVRLIQMVCHRFHTAKAEQSKEKDESEATKPSKKRWWNRLQRANNCHARIHLRVAMDPKSNDHEGETQMIYYPTHFHDDEEDTQETLDKVREKHPHDKIIVGSHKGGGGSNSSLLGECDSGSSFSLDSTSDILQLQGEDSNKEAKLDSRQESPVTLPMTSVPVSSLIASHAPVGSVLLSHQPTSLSHTNVIFDGGASSPAGTGVIGVSGGEEGQFIVMNPTSSPSQPQGGETPEYSEEYVLPADDAEWTKLFDALAARLHSGELSQAEEEEGQTILSYRTFITVASISEQVSIFQRMCSLTNTSLESV